MRKLMDYMLCRKCDSRSMRAKAIVFNWMVIFLILLFLYNIITSLMDPNREVIRVVITYSGCFVTFFALYNAAKAIR